MSEKAIATIIDQQPAPEVLSSGAYKGLYTTTRIPSCVLEKVDLRRLYVELNQSAIEAASYEFEKFTRPNDLTPDDFERVKANELSQCGVMVHVHGRDGQLVAGRSGSVLEEANLPDAVTRVRFDSAFGFQLLYPDMRPLNRFDLVLDFSEPPSFNAYNPWDEPTPNASALQVVGPRETWVAGVQSRAMSFMTRRSAFRGWLHSPWTFNVANYFVGIPAALWLVYRVDGALAPALSALPVVVRSGFHVWLFLMVALLFRVLVWLMRWAFPHMELRGAKTWKVRVTAGGVVGALAVAFLYDVLKAILT